MFGDEDEAEGEDDEDSADDDEDEEDFGDESDEDGVENEESDAAQSEEDDELIVGAARWKRNIANKAKESFVQRQLNAKNLHSVSIISLTRYCLSEPVESLDIVF